MVAPLVSLASNNSAIEQLQTLAKNSGSIHCSGRPFLPNFIVPARNHCRPAWVGIFQDQNGAFTFMTPVDLLPFCGSYNDETKISRRVVHDLQ
jgi:hypothetical protein